MDELDHYYVFVRRGAALFYERTCGAAWAADRRVQELGARGLAAFYLRNRLPGERWFY